MKHALLAALLLLATALGALELDMTLMGETLFQVTEHPFVFCDVNGDGVDEWFLLQEVVAEDSLDLLVTGYNIAGEIVAITSSTIYFPQDSWANSVSIDIHTHLSEPVLCIAYISGQAYNGALHLVMLSFPDMNVISESSHNIEFYWGEPNDNNISQTVQKLQTMLIDDDVYCVASLNHGDYPVIDGYGSSYSYLQRWQLTDDSATYIDSIDAGGYGLAQSPTEPNQLVSLDRAYDWSVCDTEFSESILLTISSCDIQSGNVTDMHSYSGSHHYGMFASGSHNWLTAINYIKQPRSDVAENDYITGFVCTRVDDNGLPYPPYEYWTEFAAVKGNGEVLTGQVPGLNLQFQSATFIDLVHPHRYCLVSYRSDVEIYLAVLDLWIGTMSEPYCLGEQDVLDVFHTDGDYYAIVLNTATSMYQIYRIDNFTLAADDEAAPAPQPALTAYPNPFNPETTVRFEMAQPGPARLEVYNIRGQRVATLLDEPLPAGEKEVTWNANCMSSGVYLVRLHTEGGDQTTKLVLLK